MYRITIDPLTETDIEIAEYLMQAAFGHKHSLVDSIRMTLEMQPGGYFLATLNGRPVGMGGALDYGPFAYLGMMAVLPEMQGKRIGAALVKHILAWTERRSIHTVLLDATDVGARLYGHFGFTACGRVDMFKAPPGKNFDHPRRPIQHLDDTHIENLIEFDKTIFGAPRRDLFKQLLRRYPGRAIGSFGSDGLLKGYLVAQSMSLGPWAALTPDDAKILFQTAMTLEFQAGYTVIVPRINQDGLAMMADLGFAPVLSNFHMQRGPSGPIRQREYIYGQTNFSLG